MALARKVLILQKNGQNHQVWTTLRPLCEAMSIEDPDFPSYWTLTRKNITEGLAFSTSAGSYRIDHFDIKP